MGSKILSLKKDFYNELDSAAKGIAAAIDGYSASQKILDTIHSLYNSAQTERLFKSNLFDCAYHNPITSEFEFLIARTLGYYIPESAIWLRRQQNKIAPDVCVRYNDLPVAVVEIKSKAGWIQPFFSNEREKKDAAKFKNGAEYDPKAQIEKIRGQLLKYSDKLGIDKKMTFMLLPTLAHVHRKKSTRKLGDYFSDFARNSHLPKENLILLSANMSLDLARKCSPADYMPTKQFEDFAKVLKTTISGLSGGGTKA